MRYLYALIITTLGIFVQAQNVGIHVSNPQKDIHMKGNVQLDDNNDKTYFQLVKEKQSIHVGSFNLLKLSPDSIGFQSTAFGLENTATGNHSFSHGYQSRAAGNTSFAFGGNIKALDEFTFGQGWNHVIEGMGSVAFGLYNETHGIYNFVTGWNNRSFESHSSVFGKDNDAYGINNFVAGRNLEGSSYLASYFGQYNSGYLSSVGEVWDPLEPIFVVGNGETQAQANNAFVILKNGDIGVDVKNPTERLEVDGNIKTTGNFIGNGSQLTNLPEDGHWFENSTHIYNNDKKVSLGASSNYRLTVSGNKAIMINNLAPSSDDKGIETRLVESPYTSVVPQTRIGHVLNVRAPGSNTGVLSYVEGTGSQVGVKGEAKGSDISVKGVIGEAKGNGTFHDGGYFKAEGGSVNSGVYAVAEGASNSTNYGIYATASGGTNTYAGYFHGDVVVSDDLVVESKITTEYLKVGPGASSNFRAMQGGTFTAGADNTQGDQDPATGTKVMSVTFPYAFPTIPKIIITATGQPGTTWNDAFSVTTRSVTTTGCVLIIKRLDSNDLWSQNLKIDWFGFSF